MALSMIPDQTHSYKGQEYIFVDQLEDYLKEIECPICRSIVSEPVLTSCGHLFCRECHNKVDRPRGVRYGIKRNGQCPVCTQEHTAMEDKFNDRRVKNLKVRCINHREGCDWVGCLGDEGQHRMKQDGCAYEEIPCAHGCSVTIRRKDQQTHSVSCLMRTHKCKYCHEDGPYQCITGEHLETCRRYPVQCPNGCKEKLPREEVLNEIRLKEVLSAVVQKLDIEEERARQLERDNRAKMERIHQLETDTEVKAQRIRYLETDTETKREHIHQLVRDAEVKAKQIHNLERSTTKNVQRIQCLEEDTEAKTERIRNLERDTEAKTRQIRNLQRATTTKTERRQYLERIARLTQTEERLMKEVSQTQKKLNIIVIILICFVLLVYIFFKQNCF